MKLKKIAFLFFCTLTLTVLEVNSQQDKDSLGYYRSIVLKPKNINDLTKSYVFFKRQKEKNLAIKNVDNLLDNLWYISSSQYKLGAYNDSENSLIEGMELLDVSPTSSHYMALRRSILNQLGLIKRKQENYYKSLEYYSRYLEYSITKSDSASVYNNIGVVYLYNKKYKQSKESFEKSYKLSLQLKDSLKIAVRLNNLGHVKSKLNDKTALKYLLESLKIRKIKKEENLFRNYEHLAEYYKDNKDIIVALAYAKKGYNYAKQTKNIPQRLSALRQLVDLKSGYQFVNEYNLLRDKVDSEKLLMGQEYASAKYDYTKVENKRKEEENKRKEAELREEKEKSERITYQFLGSFVLLSSVFIFFILKSRHKKAKLKERYDTERHISKKLHDEVANDVFSMMSKLQNDPTTKKEVIDNLEEVYLKTRDISKANAAIEVSKDFDLLLKDLIASYKTESVNIFTRNVSEISWDSVSKQKKETLYRVIQELMTNMRKHSKADLVTLQFEEKNNKILVKYVDNGIGSELKFGTGLRNTENRMELAGGSITFESETNKGFQVKMTV
jgi:signal transduction histidine kinase